MPHFSYQFDLLLSNKVLRGIVISLFIVSHSVAHAQFGFPQHVAWTEINAQNNPHYPQMIECVDLDGDGLKDILTDGYINGQGGVIWFKNLGGQEFSTPLPISVGQSNRQVMTSMDANGDGELDVLTSAAGILGYYPNLGGGAFSDSLVYIDTVHVNNLTSPIKLIHADLNGDLLEDILVTTSALNAFTRRLWWYENTGTGFGPAQIVNSTIPGQSGTDVGDFDGDGDLDIVYSWDSSNGTTQAVGYMLNDGAGTFGPRTPIPNIGIGIKPKDARLLDMDLDGDLDIISLAIIAGAHLVRVFLNDGSGQFASNVDINIGTLSSLRALGVMDIDQNGYPDVMVSKYDSQGDEHWTRAFFNDGSPVLSFTGADTLAIGAVGIVAGAPGEVFTYGTGGVLKLKFNTQNTEWSIAQVSNEVPRSRSHFVDVDGDGLIDIVKPTGWRSVLWYKNNGNGASVRSQVLVTDLQADVVELHDLDGDLDLDVLAYEEATPTIRAVTVPANGGKGTELYQKTGIDLVEVADTDGDGDHDFLGTAGVHLYHYMNDGTGNYTNSWNAYASPSLRYTAFHDYDLNGDLDILLNGQYNNGLPNIGLQWSQNTGGGSFVYSSVIDPIPVNQSGRLYSEDIDADGLDDVIEYTGDTMWWRKQIGPSQLAPRTFMANNWHSPRFYDLDSDGNIDILHFSTQQIAWTRALGAGQFSNTRDPIINSFAIDGGYGTKEWAADMDNDGDLEIIFSGRNSYNAPNYLAMFENFSTGATVQGSTFVDDDADGQFDPTESPVPLMNVVLDPLGAQTSTGQSGGYTIYADVGNYSLECPGPWTPNFWTLTSGSTGYQFQLTSAGVDSLDFGLSSLLDTSLVQPSMTFGSVPCGANTSLWLSYANLGTLIEQGEVMLDLDSAYTYLSSTPAPASVNGNVITWAFDSLLYFDMSNIHLEVVSPTVAFLGDTIRTLMRVKTMIGGNVTGTFDAECEEVLACSYDPNDKQVDPAGYSEIGAVPIPQDHLDYTIRFQNTGTDTALNVMLRDTLSGYVLPESIQLLGASHGITSFSVDAASMLEVQFLNIQLPDSGANFPGSQGFVKFRVALQSNLPHLTEINNSASIFFDLNDPVITNTTITTLVDCSQWMPQITQLSSHVLEATLGDSYQWYFNGSLLPFEDQQVLTAQTLGTYTVQVTNEYGCIMLSDPVAVITLNVAQNSESSFRLVPNPITAEAVLYSSFAFDPQVEVEVVNIHGQVVQRHQGNGTSQVHIERNGLHAGIYLLRILQAEEQLGSLRMVLR